MPVDAARGSTRPRSLGRVLLAGLIAAASTAAVSFDDAPEPETTDVAVEEALEPGETRLRFVVPEDRVELHAEDAPTVQRLSAAVAERGGLEAVPPPEPEPEPAPEPAPAPEPQPQPAPEPEPEPEAQVASTSSNAGVWDRVAQCESGGNWSINTGNGYYGGLQFSLQSWRAVGGTGYPHEASKATQIQMAERLLERQGWVAWPACSKKLGLR